MPPAAWDPHSPHDRSCWEWGPAGPAAAARRLRWAGHARAGGSGGPRRGSCASSRGSPRRPRTGSRMLSGTRARRTHRARSAGSGAPELLRLRCGLRGRMRGGGPEGRGRQGWRCGRAIGRRSSACAGGCGRSLGHGGSRCVRGFLRWECRGSAGSGSAGRRSRGP